MCFRIPYLQSLRDIVCSLFASDVQFETASLEKQIRSGRGNRLAMGNKNILGTKKVT